MNDLPYFHMRLSIISFSTTIDWMEQAKAAAKVKLKSIVSFHFWSSCSLLWAWLAMGVEPNGNIMDATAKEEDDDDDNDLSAVQVTEY